MRRLAYSKPPSRAPLSPLNSRPLLKAVRPGLEGRFAFRHGFANDGHIEIAPGFHVSTTHVAATSVPSRMYSVDWSIAPNAETRFLRNVLHRREHRESWNAAARLHHHRHTAGNSDSYARRLGAAELCGHSATDL